MCVDYVGMFIGKYTNKHIHTPTAYLRITGSPMGIYRYSNRHSKWIIGTIMNTVAAVACAVVEDKVSPQQGAYQGREDLQLNQVGSGTRKQGAIVNEPFM